jgi:hypothetical protein
MVSTAAKIATRIGLALALLGLASCVLNVFGFEVRALRALDSWGPLAAWGLRIGLMVVGAILGVGGMFFDRDEDPEHRAQVAKAATEARNDEVRTHAADPRIAQLLQDLAQQAQLTLELPTDPAVYQVVRILWTNAAGSWFRGHTTTLLGPADAEVAGAVLCLKRLSEPRAHVLASRSFATGQIHVQPTDLQTWNMMAQAGA